MSKFFNHVWLKVSLYSIEWVSYYDFSTSLAIKKCFSYDLNDNGFRVLIMIVCNNIFLSYDIQNNADFTFINSILFNLLYIIL